MQRTKSILVFLSLLSIVCLWSFADEDWIIETRLFKAAKQDGPAKPGSPIIITTFSAPLMISSRGASPSSVADPESVSAMKSELAKIYQLKNVDYISSGQIVWDGKREILNEAILLDGALYPIDFSPKAQDGRMVFFRIDMRRQSGQEMTERIINTEMSLRPNDPVVLGFPVNGHSYFLSLQVRKQSDSEVREAAVRTGPKDEVPVSLDLYTLPQPKVTIMPVYPEKCKKANIQGTVVLLVGTDKEGRVDTVRVLEKDHPDLAKAAVKAIEQWVYEPVISKGKPIPAIFYMKVYFRLSPVDSPQEAPEDTEEDPVRKW
jgi:TonB family protein